MSIKIKSKIIFRFFILSIFLFSIFIITPKALAATINLNPANGLYKVGDTIYLNVSISSDTSVNAVAAKISYPTDLLTLSSISKDKSIVSLYAQQPLYSNIEGIATFEGVILYGYTGDSGNILTLVFKAKNIGTANIKFNTASILANDGEGTETLSGKNGSTLTIIKGEGQEITPVKGEKGSTVITIKEINESDNYSRNKFFITADRTVKDNLYSIQIDSMNPIMWIDEGTHIFETPLLSEGIHTIRIIASDLNLNLLSGSLDFSTKILKVPVVTSYTKKVKVGQPIIIRGLADPYVDVEFASTNNETSEVVLGHAQTNIDGKFTYIPENENEAGSYSITARARAKNGVNSGYMDSIEILVKDSFFKVLLAKIMRMIAILMPYLILIIIFILLIMYAIYRIKKYQIYLRRKLKEKEDITTQEFKKLEQETQNQVRGDIEKTEAVIGGGMKDLEKDVENL
jgi:hypothetical protein